MGEFRRSGMFHTEERRSAELDALDTRARHVTDYDRYNMLLYAALLDDADAGVDWRETARTLMQADPDGEGAELCWRSHLERARWIIGEGLASALDVHDAPTGDQRENCLRRD